MTRAIGTAVITIPTARSTPTKLNRHSDEPIVLAAPVLSPFPMFCPNKTVHPIVSPVIIPVIVCIVILPVETADTAAASENNPTIIKSTVPYIA